ncbi:MAG: RES family NAD+ phosphorylase, partial [Acidobacteriaceae bacterium]|nr:RES family NAD+ phosphorylase [Acidobacteriaceae bacterium]
VVYASESEALATLEVLVHLSSLMQVPQYVCVKARIPEELVVDVSHFGLLPSDWASAEPINARMLGTRWILNETLGCVARSTTDHSSRSKLHAESRPSGFSAHYNC